jgi:hypothetical protein
MEMFDQILYKFLAGQSIELIRWVTDAGAKGDQLLSIVYPLNSQLLYWLLVANKTYCHL